MLGIDIQAVTLPPRFCDSRVKIMQADAREVSPLVFQVSVEKCEGGKDGDLGYM